MSRTDLEKKQKKCIFLKIYCKQAENKGVLEGKMSDIPRKRERFIKEYLLDLNATAAAIRAGYSKKTAYSTGHALLKRPEIQAEVTRMIKKRSERTEIESDQVIQEYAHVAFSNVLDYVRIEGRDIFIDLANITRAQAAAIMEVTQDISIRTGEDGEEVEKIKKISFKLHPKLPALRDLGKHLNIFAEDNKTTLVLAMREEIAQIVRDAQSKTPEQRRARIEELRELLEDGNPNSTNGK